MKWFRNLFRRYETETLRLADPSPPPALAKAPEPPKEKRTVTCSVCHQKGHSARKCPNKADLPEPDYDAPEYRHDDNPEHYEGHDSLDDHHQGEHGTGPIINA